MKGKVTTVVTWVAALISLPSIAGAQQAPAKSITTTSGDSQALQEIVVTAEKRSGTIQEIPGSISAITAGDLVERHIDTVEDITRTVPGVSFGAGANTGMDVITIRGVSSQGGGATVGLFYNDVSIVTQNSFDPLYSGATEPKLFDLERVEVLRGPQGTLYGASAMGGAIRYITKEPNVDDTSWAATSDVSDTTHGSLNYDQSGVINVPIVPGTFAIRAGIDSSYNSGYINHYQYIGPTQAAVLQGIDDSQAGALTYSGSNWERTLALKIAGKYVSEGQLVVLPSIFYQQFNAGDTSIWYPKLGLDHQDKLVREPSTDTLLIPSVTLSDDLHWADLTAIVSYFSRENSHTTDGTYFNSDFVQYLADTSPDLGPCQCGVAFWDLPGPSLTQQTTRTQTLEVRLASKSERESGHSYTWLGGLYVSDRKISSTDYEYVTGVRSEFFTLYGKDPANTSFADPLTNDLLGWSVAHDKQREFAAFANVSYLLTPDLKATAGVRESYAQTAFDYYNAGYFAQGITPYTNLHNNYTSTSPKVSLSYDIDKDATVYVSASKGFRVGGYIIPIDTTTGLCPGALATVGITNPKLAYGPDSLWSYELGAKTNWFDRHLTVNASGYYINWSHIQQTFVLSCGSPYTANFGDAVSYGGELEVLAKPIQGLTLGLNAGLTHATLTSVVPNVGAAVGEHLLNAPDYGATVNGEYRWKVTAKGSAFMRGDYEWVGKSYGAFDRTSVAYSRPSYGTANAFLGFELGNVTFSLYAKNLFNDQKIIQEVPIELLISAYSLRPRTIGLQVKAGL